MVTEDISGSKSLGFCHIILLIFNFSNETVLWTFNMLEGPLRGISFIILNI